MRRERVDGSAGVGGSDRRLEIQLRAGNGKRRAEVALKSLKAYSVVSLCRELIRGVEEHSSSPAQNGFFTRAVVNSPRNTEPRSEVELGRVPQGGSLWGKAERTWCADV